MGRYRMARLSLLVAAALVIAAFARDVTPLNAYDDNGVGESDHESDDYSDSADWPPALSRAQVRANNEKYQKKGLQKFDATHEANPDDADITGVKKWQPDQPEPEATMPLSMEEGHEEQGEAQDSSEDEDDEDMNAQPKDADEDMNSD